MTESTHSHEQTLADYIAVLKRRKWIVLLPLIIAPVVAVAMSRSQPKLFRASADVLLASSATGASSGLESSSPSVDTQVQIAGSPVVQARALKATGLAGSPTPVLSGVSIGGSSTGDTLTVSITSRSADDAVKLANAFSQQYILYRRQLDTSFVRNARNEIQARMNALRAAGDTHSALYNTLLQKDQDLLEVEALQTVSGVLLRPASGAAQIQPTPTRNGIMGFGLGLVLGVALALLWEAVDTKLRTAHDVSTTLGLPLLGRLYAPSRRTRDEEGLVMLGDPQSAEAEAFRQLRSSLDFANVDLRAKTIMITSSLQGEGKSTTAANLAVSLAKSGREVALVDLDLREPALHKLFMLQGYRWVHGLTSVALGKVSLDDAIAYLPVSGPSRRSPGEAGAGMLQVLPCGPVPSDPGEFVNSAAVRNVIDELARRADVVIIDAPPLLGVGDASSISHHVDAIVMVARIGQLRRPQLREARRILDVSTAMKLGFVITGAEREEGYGYSRYPYYSRPSVNAVGQDRHDERLTV